MQSAARDTADMHSLRDTATDSLRARGKVLERRGRGRTAGVLGRMVRAQGASDLDGLAELVDG
jgi:hypothetical protein